MALEHAIQTRLKSMLERWQTQRTIGYPQLQPGPTNRISDVHGVKVGHVTLNEGDIQTGVSAIVPNDDNLFVKPLRAGAAVLNGFAKPIGLTQLDELGILQTPIVLSNTFSVGRLYTGVVRYSISQNPEVGRELATVNPLVLECNDGFLNDQQAFALTESMAVDAITSAQSDFARGSVGAGRGMSCFGLKGGIGTSSRYIPELDATLGVLVLANFGRLQALHLEGLAIGEWVETALTEVAAQRDAGSIIIVMATDAPLSSRQLRRVAKRSGAGLGRLGSYWGHGSGDIAVAFSTAHEAAHDLDDSHLEELLCAAAEGCEFAVLDALLQARPVTGFRNHTRMALSDVLDYLATTIV
ncbi:DmpA family aminopeptidase [Celerinatantimonas diazotrophica]|uniref:D-aminopeptidase n=1 Tax=Celerinatantimonas diazotrophica TaxID=412034 RepID=A0A4R1J7I8_9GAMM|nr:P1 family peptidase [Celerinatantimonas diazotrophica]TCK46429.1 D-aminopeptidase [Celerinatantimonas diazotrophica]CAG9295194.1 Beta-peptidyl aminopeptidase BapA [Celerinatantimonas diazotrophica]